MIWIFVIGTVPASPFMSIVLWRLQRVHTEWTVIEIHKKAAMMACQAKKRVTLIGSLKATTRGTRCWFIVENIVSLVHILRSSLNVLSQTGDYIVSYSGDILSKVKCMIFLRQIFTCSFAEYCSLLFFCSLNFGVSRKLRPRKLRPVQI